jgi:hypothetical protein
MKESPATMTCRETRRHGVPGRPPRPHHKPPQGETRPHAASPSRCAHRFAAVPSSKPPRRHRLRLRFPPPLAARHNPPRGETCRRGSPLRTAHSFAPADRHNPPRRESRRRGSPLPVDHSFVAAARHNPHGKTRQGGFPMGHHSSTAAQDTPRREAPRRGSLRVANSFVAAARHNPRGKTRHLLTAPQHQATRKRHAA